MTLNVQETEDGLVFSAQARAGARSNEIRGIQDGALRVYVTPAPEKGKANKAIITLLARQLGIAKSNLKIISGQTSALKKIKVNSLTLAELNQRIEKIVD